jgi:hypothetical protein
MRHIETNRLRHLRSCREHDVAGSAREIEQAIGWLQARKSDQPLLPASILTVGKKSGDEVVAVGDGGKQPPDVSLFALRSRDRAP